MRRRRVLHLAAFNRNVGDNALNHAIERMLGDRFDIEQLELVGNPFGDREFELMNDADAVIFGGGGVIHSCSGGGSRKNREKTGTMWNMELERIGELQCKIVLYSVGFNKFDGEPEPLLQMGSFFDLLNEKRALVSMRNDLSKQRFLDYFPRFEGMPVTPDPGLFCRGSVRKTGEKYGLLQIATDRLEFRYPQGIEKFIDLVNALAAAAGCKVFLIPHTSADEKIYREHAWRLEVDRILDCRLAFDDVLGAMDLYRNAEFTISTRGHSQICSVGNGVPTFALSTHPKARGFMDEVGQLEACFDYLTEPHSECLPRFKHFLSRLPEIRRELAEANRRFDADIERFNQSIVEYVEGRHSPPAFLTAPTAAPRLQAATLNGAGSAASGPAGARPRRETDKSAAYLPGGTTKVGVGTYVRGARVGDAAPAALRNPPRAAVRPVSRTLDGATCGVVVSCDANYFPGLSTCINAIRRYNPSLPITFLDAGLRMDQASAIQGVVDDYRRLDELINLDVKAFPSHLSKAALSSLYVDYAPYDKVMYLDVDALVLDDLKPMFEALDVEHDIVGIRGNIFKSSTSLYKHTVVHEIAGNGVLLLKRAFPQADFSAPAINSGCFVVKRSVAANWRSTVEQLLPYLHYFKTADQALLNVMTPLRGLRLKLFDPMYNCMGLQLANPANIVQDARVRVSIDEMSCKVFFGDRQVKVAHFAGRHKPWLEGDDHPLRFAWDWHGAPDPEQQLGVLERYRLWNATSEWGLQRELDEMVARGQASEFHACLQAGHLARERGHFGAAVDCYRRALRRRPNSFAGLRGLALAGAGAGELTQTAELAAAEPLAASKDSRLLKEKVKWAAALAGDDWPIEEPETAGAQLVSARRHFRNGELDQAARRLNIANTPSEERPEQLLLMRAALDDDLTRLSAWAEAVYTNRRDTLRRAGNAALRKAKARLAGLWRYARERRGRGPLLQVGAGTGAFLNALATVAEGAPVSLDAASRAKFLDHDMPVIGPAALPALVEQQGPLGWVVLAHLWDRIEDCDRVALALSRLLGEGGVVLVVDGFNEVAQIDCLEGLKLIPARKARPSVEQLTAAFAGSGLTLDSSWLVEGERMLAFTQGEKEDRVAFPPADLRPLTQTFERIEAGAALAETRGFIDEYQGFLAQQRDALSIFVDQADAAAEEQPDADAEEQESASNLEGDEQGFDQEEVADPSPASGEQSLVALQAGSAELPGQEAAGEEQGEAATRIARRFVHVAYFDSINAGDRILCEQTASLFLKDYPKHARIELPLNAQLTERRMTQLNAARFVLVGGGGIFHSSSRAEGFWQWRLDEEQLSSLKTPLVLFGVGLNEFRGGDLYSSELFSRRMRQVAEKSIFMGFRERRSCDILRALLPEHADKVFYQPCAAYQIGFALPALRIPRLSTEADPKRAAINVAFDRCRSRYGAGFRDKMRALDRLVNALLDDGVSVTCLAHTPEDRVFHDLLSRRGDVDLASLHGASSKTAALCYERYDLVIGMRTHSQIIPFALGVPTMSLITHDKLEWALDDLGVQNWGVDLDDTEFDAKAISVCRGILGDLLSARSTARREVVKIDTITRQNIKRVKRALRRHESEVVS